MCNSEWLSATSLLGQRAHQYEDDPSASLEIVVELVALGAAFRLVIALRPSRVCVRIASRVANGLAGLAARLGLGVRVDAASLVRAERVSDVVVVAIVVAVGALAGHALLTVGIARNERQLVRQMLAL